MPPVNSRQIDWTAYKDVTPQRSLSVPPPVQPATPQQYAPAQQQNFNQQPATPDVANTFNAALMDLMKKYQTLGTKPFEEQALNAQQEQANRMSTTDPNLIGADPALQNSVRSGAAQALQPLVNSANNSSQTFSEQLKTFGDTVGTARGLLKDYEDRQNKSRDDARNVIKDAFTIGGAESLKGLSPDEITKLEKAAGYPSGYIHGVSQTLKERELQLQRDNALLRASVAGSKPATGAERTNLGYYTRAVDALSTIAPLEDGIRTSSTASQFQLQFAPNILQNKDQQVYRQAQRQFTEARLRKESGAAISDSEYAKDSATYFAQPGDDAATLARKQAARQVVLNSLKISSGKAYDEYYGGSPDASMGGQDQGGTSGVTPSGLKYTVTQ